MALHPINFFGPDVNHVASYYQFTGLTFVSSPAAPGSGWWAKDTLKATRDVTAGVPILGKDRYYYVQRGFRQEKTGLSSGDKFGIIAIGSRSLWGTATSATAYKIELRNSAKTLLATTTSTYGQGASVETIDFRLTFTGGEIILEVKGAEEIRYADTYKPTTTGTIRLLGVNPLDGGVNADRLWNCGLFYATDNRSERTDTDVQVDRLDPNANGNYGDWANNDDCADGTGGGAADYTRWDDYAGGGTPDHVTYNCAQAIDDYEQSSLLTTATMKGVIIGPKAVFWGQANVSGKQVNWPFWYREGGSESPIRTMAWVDNVQDNINEIVLKDPPSGGAWTQAKVDGLEMAMKSDADNPANVENFAIATEMCSVSADPEPAAADPDPQGIAALVGVI